MRIIRNTCTNYTKTVRHTSLSQGGRRQILAPVTDHLKFAVRDVIRRFADFGKICKTVKHVSYNSWVSCSVSCTTPSVHTHFAAHCDHRVRSRHVVNPLTTTTQPAPRTQPSFPWPLLLARTSSSVDMSIDFYMCARSHALLAPSPHVRSDVGD